MSNTPDQPENRQKKPKKKRRLRRLIVLLVIVILLGFGGFTTYQSLRAEYRVTYDPYTASTGTISNSLSFNGTMQLVNNKTYTATSEAKVREIYVKVGDTVREGDRLIRLSNGDSFTADFAGKINKIDVEKGDEVKAGANLVQVADFDHMRVSVRVGESNITSIFIGQSCRVTVASINATFNSSISAVDYASYTGNNVAYYTTTVDVDTSSVSNVYPGMQATVTIPQQEASNVVVLKMDAISTDRENNAFVYKQSADGVMQQSPIKVGVSNGNYVEIREGVSDGETVYAVAKKDETATGLNAMFSSMFGSQQVNTPGRNNNYNNNGGFNRNNGGGNTRTNPNRGN